MRKEGTPKETRLKGTRGFLEQKTWLSNLKMTSRRTETGELWSERSNRRSASQSRAMIKREVVN